MLINLSKDIQELIKCYCDGVNYYVENSFSLPLEFWILREKFDPWLPIHSIGLAKLMQFTTTNGW